jgi:hypothetical protein
MNFLQLVQQLQLESGAGNAPITNVSSQIGEGRRLVDWISSANLRIQSMYVDWKYLRSELPDTYQTGIGQQDYAPPDDLNYWNKKSFIVDDIDIPAFEFRPRIDRLNRNDDTDEGRPNTVAVLDNNQLRFYPTPDDAYVVEAEYWVRPIDLDPTATDANSQISLIPEQFHWLIVWEGLRYYANYENAEDSKAQAMEGIALWQPKLEAHQLRGSQDGTVADENVIVIRAV